jgi:hypothetical protein
MIGFDDKMRLAGPYRYVHILLCVFGAMGAGRVFLPDGPISFLIAYLLTGFVSVYVLVFLIVFLAVKKQRTTMPTT